MPYVSDRKKTNLSVPFFRAFFIFSKVIYVVIVPDLEFGSFSRAVAKVPNLPWERRADRPNALSESVTARMRPSSAPL